MTQQHTFQSLTAMKGDDLAKVLAQGTAPAFSSIAGSEFRGWNVFGDIGAKAVGTVMGIQRFAKGFFVRDGAADVDGLDSIEGYNVKIQRGTQAEPWTAIPDDAHPTRFGFYKVWKAGLGEARAGRHEHALLLDYSQGNPKPGLFEGSGLKDFVVQVDADNPDLLLGTAYMTLGPITMPPSFFVAERLRKVDFRP
ncbi:MAG: hypothetical protein Q8O67_22190 [Deltaproteobacteria bacterium]|nr:hypothetical protein [Deltaproteobacteria bacterium]